MTHPKALDFELGPVPAEEACAQVGHDDYSERSRRECAVYIRQLQRVFMKKISTLGIMLAVTGAAHAQTSVTLYGLIDTAIPINRTRWLR